jgi:hypothetical protein
VSKEVLLEFTDRDFETIDKLKKQGFVFTHITLMDKDDNERHVHIVTQALGL